MKIASNFMALVLSLALLQANAQIKVPNGFKKGTVVLAGGNTIPGFIKDNMRIEASIVFLAEAGGKKKTYDASQLNSIEIEGVKFLCISRDFFKVLSEGDLNFLQKSSDVSGKVFYNGNEPIASVGTEGRPGDYFMYGSISKQLNLISKKNFDEVIATSFENNTAAIDKAKTVRDDLSRLKEAVDIYNKHESN
jgi:hypothetical protein